MNFISNCLYGIFVAYLQGKEREKLITRGDAATYANYLLHEKNVSHKTLHRNISVLVTYWEYLISIGEVNTNIFRSIVSKFENKPIVPTKVLVSDQVKKIFLLSENSHLDQTIFTILFYTGMRVGELVSLKRNSYVMEEEFGKKHWVLKYVAKRDKVVKKVLNDKFVNVINDYLDYMNEIGREVLASDPLLQPSRNFFREDGTLALNRPISVSYIKRIFKKYFKKIDISEMRGYSAHSARTTLITTLIEKGCDIYAVSKEMGHNDVATTQRCYDRSRRKLADSLLLEKDIY
ncbi:MAG: site-specific integrase [Oligoflexia bacterium]|nr:site-specific integrase [Oligoflexia bacterium]